MICCFKISRGTKGDQPRISCGEFITTLGREEKLFAIKTFFAHVKNTDQNFHPTGLELVKIP